MQLLLSMLAAALPGTWTSPCTTTDEGVLANQRATFTENSTIQTVNQADDLYCSHVVMANSVEASYTVGTPTDFATPIDYTITKVTVVVQDPEYV